MLLVFPLLEAPRLPCLNLLSATLLMQLQDQEPSFINPYGPKAPGAGDFVPCHHLQIQELTSGEVNSDLDACSGYSPGLFLTGDLGAHRWSPSSHTSVVQGKAEPAQGEARRPLCAVCSHISRHLVPSLLYIHKVWDVF